MLGNVLIGVKSNDWYIVITDKQLAASWQNVWMLPDAKGHGADLSTVKMVFDVDLQLNVLIRRKSDDPIW